MEPPSKRRRVDAEEAPKAESDDVEALVNRLNVPPHVGGGGGGPQPRDAFGQGAGNSSVHGPQTERSAARMLRDYYGMYPLPLTYEHAVPLSGGAGAGAGAGESAELKTPQKESKHEEDDSPIEIKDDSPPKYKLPPEVEGYRQSQEGHPKCAVCTANNAIGQETIDPLTYDRAADGFWLPYVKEYLKDKYGDRAPEVDDGAVAEALMGLGYNLPYDVKTGFSPFEINTLLFYGEQPYALRRVTRTAEEAKKFRFPSKGGFYVHGKYVGAARSHAIAVRDRTVLDSNLDVTDPYKLHQASAGAKSGYMPYTKEYVIDMTDSTWYPPNYIPSTVYKVEKLKPGTTIDTAMEMVIGNPVSQASLRPALEPLLSRLVKVMVHDKALTLPDE